MNELIKKGDVMHSVNDHFRDISTHLSLLLSPEIDREEEEDVIPGTR